MYTIQSELIKFTKVNPNEVSVRLNEVVIHLRIHCIEEKLFLSLSAQQEHLKVVWLNLWNASVHEQRLSAKISGLGHLR